MAAIAIIAALVVIAIPAYKSYQNKARSAEATTFLSAGQIAEKSFFQAEKSYTACLPSIMDVPSNQQLYYAIGFNLDPSGTYTCGPNNDQSCLQKCFSDPARCSTTPAPCGFGSYSSATPNTVAFASNALPSNVDFYGALTPGSSYYSSIGSNDFEIVAATDESQFTKNDFLEKLYPSAYAASWKVYAIGPSGGVYEKVNNTCSVKCIALSPDPKLFNDHVSKVIGSDLSYSDALNLKNKSIITCSKLGQYTFQTSPVLISSPYAPTITCP